MFAASLIDEPAAEELVGGAKLLLGAAGALLAKHIVEAAMQDGFGIFAVGGCLFDALDQVVVTLALGIDGVGQLAVGG